MNGTMFGLLSMKQAMRDTITLQPNNPSVDEWQVLLICDGNQCGN